MHAAWKLERFTTHTYLHTVKKEVEIHTKIGGFISSHIAPDF